MKSDDEQVASDIDLAEIEALELVVLGRMKEFALGSHDSVFQGGGFDFVGLRDWQPGDRPSSIDWSESIINNFSPLVTREYEQESTASIVIVADDSLSTRCGAVGISIGATISRALATLGLAGVFFQDMVGLITMNQNGLRLLSYPRSGKDHLIHLLGLYQNSLSGRAKPLSESMGFSLSGFTRRRAVVPIISDFLFSELDGFLEGVLAAKDSHDVFLVVVDSSVAFSLPAFSAGWLQGRDVETGQVRLFSSREIRRMPSVIKDYQRKVVDKARTRGIDALLVQHGREHAGLSAFLDARGRRRL